MKIVSYTKYGNPEVLHIVKEEVPIPKPTEILIEVRAASLNPAEWHYMKATLVLLRLVKGLFKPKNPYLGADISGVVAQVGSEVSQFKKGDEVYGRNLIGGYAEYACIDQNMACLKPSNLSFKQVAALPLASLTALQALRAGNISENKKVLINGASGGIGTLSTQIAKFHQAEVTGVCSTPNVDLIKTLGCDFVLDYTKESLDRHNKTYDLILDLVGNLSNYEIEKLLNMGGTCVIVGFESMGKMLKAGIKHRKKTNPNQKNYKMITTEIIQKDLQFIKQLSEENKISPVIDRVFLLEQVQEAFSYLGTKRAKGKIVIEIKADNKMYS